MGFKGFVTVIAIVGLVSVGVVADEDIYQWTDESGNIHYSGKPHPTLPSTYIGKKSKLGNSGDQSTDETQKNAANVQLCTDARSNYQIFTSGAEVRRRDEYGEITVLTAEEVEKGKERAQAAIDRYCG